MKLKTLFGTSIIAATVGMLLGCDPPLPENPRGAGPKADPAMAQARIKETMDNPNFSAAQKQQIINTIKQKNHLQ